MAQNSLPKSYIRLFINEFDALETTEIQHLLIDTVMGGRLPTLKLSATTSSNQTLHHFMSETSRIAIIIGEVGKDGKITCKSRYMFFITGFSLSTPPANGRQASFSVTAIADLYNKPSLLATPIKQNKNSKVCEFIKELFDDDGSKMNPNFQKFIAFNTTPPDWEATPESKIQILDMISSNSNDTRPMSYSGVSKLEAINEVISNSKLKENTPIGHYFTHNRETGALDLVLFDVAMRCKSFNPKSSEYRDNKVQHIIGYSNKNNNWIPASDLTLNIRGAEHSALYWERTVDSYNKSEDVRFQSDLKSNAMFSDGLEFPISDIKLKQGPVDVFTMFRTGVQLKRADEQTQENVEKEYTNTRAIYQRYMRALEKINVKVVVDGLYGADIGDIYELHFPNLCRSERNAQIEVDDKILTGNYMLTRVFVEYTQGKFSTILILSRDSFSNGSKVEIIENEDANESTSPTISVRT